MVPRTTSRTPVSRRQVLRLLGGGAGALAGLGASAGCQRLVAPASELLGSTDPAERHPASFWETVAGDAVQCNICYRRCIIAPDQLGFCQHRRNAGGSFYSILHSRPSAIHTDPIEKEPAFHVLPGSLMHCIGTAGCNFRCQHCHNWHLSQRQVHEMDTYEHPPERAVEQAMETEAQTVSFTYNEPTIYYEYMRDVAAAAQGAGLLTMFHTNGSMETEPLKALLPVMDAVVVDLKAFTEDFYRVISEAQLAPVLRTLTTIREAGVHLEIVNLVIPGYNDAHNELRAMCSWIHSELGADTPLHFTRFVPAYRLTRVPSTPVETLEAATMIADEVGLQWVYIGNVPGHDRNSTYCPSCRRMLIHRIHFTVLGRRVVEGRCGECGHPVPGLWSDTWRNAS